MTRQPATITSEGRVSVIVIGDENTYAVNGDWLSNDDAFEVVIATLRDHFRGVELDGYADVTDVPGDDLVRVLNENSLGVVRVDIIPLVTDIAPAGRR